MEKLNKENIIFSIISLLVLITTIFSLTYAFFSANVTSSASLNVVAGMNSAATPILTVTNDGNLAANITGFDMLQGDANNTTASRTSNQYLTVSMIGGSVSRQASCTYDIVWTAGSTVYTPSSGRGNLKELTLKITDSSGVPVLYETNIDSLTSGNAVATNLTITSNGTLTEEVYTVTMSIYNLNINQDGLKNKTYTGEVSIDNISCGIGTEITGYWYYESGDRYTFPNYGGTMQTTGLATGHDAYIYQDSSKYNACVNDGNGHEVCLSQPYTQYGLEGHTACDDPNVCRFTNAQQESAKQAIYQAFIDEGISIDIDEDCHVGYSSVYCQDIDIYCEIDYTGKIQSGNNSDGSCCNLYRDSTIGCGC